MIKKLLAKFVKREQFQSDGHYFYTLSVRYKPSVGDIVKRENKSYGAVSGKIYRHREKFDLPAQPSPMGVIYNARN